MRRFMMHRAVDETGVSGAGYIADGVAFDDGTVVVRWRTATPGTTMFASLEHAQAVHGHGGKTAFVFHDDAGPIVWLCCMCFADMDIPANHCFQCGSGGSAIPMSASLLRLVQRHDEQRLESLAKKEAELRALRAVALAVAGPYALGLSVERFTSREGHAYASARCGATIYSGEPEAGETDEAFLRRVGPTCALDPARVLRVLSELPK